MDKIIKLLNMPSLFDEALTEFTPSFLMRVISFLPDPEAKEKQERRLENPADWAVSLKPSPRFGEWEYYEILEKGVRPLVQRAPYFVARILIDATASMIRLSSHQEERAEIPWERLDRPPDRTFGDPRVTLLSTLTFACEKVYEDSPESIEVLDQALRNQPWNFFVRLRQHLYSLNPNEQTLPWIRECILKHTGFAGVGLDYEFQLVIRKACEYFGAKLLSEAEQASILDTILSGPSINIYYSMTEWNATVGTEEEFSRWQRFHHRRKLRPFASLLTERFLDYFHELENEFADISLSDEDYLPFRVGRGGFVSHRSPRSLEELTYLENEKLLELINTWQDEHEDENDWLSRVDIEALAVEFQKLFSETINSDEERLTYWLQNRHRIKRPVYIKAIIQAIQEHVEESHFERLDIWLEFCEWVLSHLEREDNEGMQHHDHSGDYPDWGSSRRAVGDFIGACLKENVDVPFNARSSLANLLELLCTQFDRRLDDDRPLLLNRNDQITEAINNTRSRALADLANFGIWVRRYSLDDEVLEVSRILEKRFRTDAEYPLTIPEHAILGWNFGNICAVNQTWAIEHIKAFFPQNDLPVWVEAFGGFLQFNRPSKLIFEILRDEYIFALDHLAELNAIDTPNKDLPDRLGEHLFDYFAWEVFPLNGESSLLEKFYSKTSDQRQRWARLFDHVGRSLKSSRVLLKQDLKERIVAFFDWRLKAEEPEELRGFTFWLEAECLDPDWRLDAFSQVLDVLQSRSRSVHVSPDAFERMLEGHTAKVVKCYAQMTEANDYRAYFPKDQAESILSAGLNSEEESVRKDAERARGNLLDRGEYDLLDL